MVGNLTQFVVERAVKKFLEIGETFEQTCLGQKLEAGYIVHMVRLLIPEWDPSHIPEVSFGPNVNIAITPSLTELEGESSVTCREPADT